MICATQRDQDMGLKTTSSTVAIGFRVNESAANTFTQASVDLQLSPLDNEVFVVVAIDIDSAPPDALAAVNSTVAVSLTTTSQTATVSLDDSNCLAVKDRNIRGAGYLDGGVAFESHSLESPPANLNYIGIIATNDFFIQITGSNNTVAKTCTGKLYGYRAKADAATYAALVQSEVLSA